MMMTLIALILLSADEEQEVKSRIAAALREHGRNSAFAVHWESTVTFEANCFLSESRPYPRKQTSLKLTDQSFTVVDGNVSYQTGFVMVDGTPLRVDGSRYISTWNGDTERRLRDDRGGDHEVSQRGWVLASGEYSDYSNSILPICLFYAGLREPFGRFPLEDLRLLPDRVDVAEFSCHILEGEYQNQQARFFVAPALGYAIVRCELFDKNGEPKSLLHIRYRKEGDTVALTGWSHRRPGVTHNSSYVVESRVTSVALGEDVPETSFRVGFPVNTVVSDAPEGIMYRIREDGSYVLLRRGSQ